MITKTDIAAAAAKLRRPVSYVSNWVARAEENAEDAVGETMTVRTGPNSKVRGVIAEARPHAIRFRGRSVVMQWSVLLQSTNGTLATLGRFTVERLPR